MSDSSHFEKERDKKVESSDELTPRRLVRVLETENDISSIFRVSFSTR